MDKEAPPNAVSLRSYFLSKYEMTQGQWLRLSGHNPSRLPAGKPALTVQVTALHPVEDVDWIGADRVLRRHGLTLPTEAQWEYGCRAGTDTPWWTGRDRDSLKTGKPVTNIADKQALPFKQSWGFEEWPGYDDGCFCHAPIGRYRANRFGLHEVHGNLLEWCLDYSLPYSQPTEPGTGLRIGDKPGYRIARGGSFTAEAFHARSSHRVEVGETIANMNLGLRAARALH
jgi:formylglycine-generating enzyme required for sulfatase activity